MVSDSADRASVELEVFLNNKPYLIQREIRKTKAGQAHISGLVSERKGYEWVAIKGTSNDVETWVEKNLRMSHKTFVSAVLLRQGEADTFLKAKPKERKERLLEVLDLKFYKQLGELAVSKRNGIRAEVKQIEQRLEGIKKVEDNDIEKQQDSIGAIKDQYTSLQGQLAKKDEELKNSKSFAQFQDQISSAEKDRKSALDLIEKENLITTNANRFRELDKDIPALNQLHETHDRIRGYEEDGRLPRKDY